MRENKSFNYGSKCESTQQDLGMDDIFAEDVNILKAGVQNNNKSRL